MSKTKINWILGRDHLCLSADVRDEWSAAERAGFNVALCRSEVPEGAACIPRYSVMPLSREFYRDCAERRLQPVNDSQAHNFCKDIQWWYETLKDFTPRTVFDAHDLSSLRYPIMIRGGHKSCKRRFATHMFVESPRDNGRILTNFLDSPEYNENPQICWREFETFETIEVEEPANPNYPPIVNEWRCIFYNDTLLMCQFYWAPIVTPTDEGQKRLDTAQEDACVFAQTIVETIRADQPTIPFICVDVGRRLDGRWRLIEINDGQQSGLQGYSPTKFYEALYKATRGNR